MAKDIEDELEKTIVIANKMITEAKVKFYRAIDNEDFANCLHLESYIRGMEQVVILFEMIVPRRV